MTSIPGQDIGSGRSVELQASPAHHGSVTATMQVASAARIVLTFSTASGPVALYDITIRNGRTGVLVAKSQDLVYRKKEWFT